MTSLFLAPHHDDECLFGSFLILAHEPDVVVCLRGDAQKALHGFNVTHAEREKETMAALAVLGVENWSQWSISDIRPNEADVRHMMETVARRSYDTVFAPVVEEDGNLHHNLIGALADEVFGDAVTHYFTYTNGRGRSGRDHPDAVEVPYENEWIARKLCAMTKYTSQLRLDSTAHHFTEGLMEWVKA